MTTKTNYKSTNCKLYLNEKMLKMKTCKEKRDLIFIEYYSVFLLLFSLVYRAAAQTRLKSTMICC